MPIAISTDIGGTFTDLVAYDLETGTIHHAKDYTDPANFSNGIARCIDKSGLRLSEAPEFVHGSTVAINTAIERNGARTALLVTRGMRDVYAIGRSNRPEAYNLMFHRPQPLVARELIFEVQERLAAGGDVLEPLDEQSVVEAVQAAVAAGVESIAVCTLHSYANPAHEEQIGEIVRRLAPEVYLTLSHRILREYREYERISTAAMNSYIGPRVSGYLEDLREVLEARDFTGRTLIMQSNGGVMTPTVARDEPVMMMESGPVGGVVAAGAIATAYGISNAVAFDMGGTTAKAALLRDGVPDIAQGYYVGGFASGLPVRVPVVDVIEVGAGGGSIAHLDVGGALRVGPQSAGGRPGPVCYGWGGERPTVTDANAVLGRLNPARFLGGEMGLDVEAAATALGRDVGAPLSLSAEDAALAVINVAVNMMGLAVRQVSVERGVDPRDCALIAFGGAGPLHACAVAREVRIPRVIVPMLPGHFSALGMLLADIRHELVRTIYATTANADPATLTEVAHEMSTEVAELLSSERIVDKDQEIEFYLDLRYAGQEFTLRTPCTVGELSSAGDLEKVRRRFDELHELRFGHNSPAALVEIVNLRIVGIGRRERFRPTIGASEGEVQVGSRRVVSGIGSNAITTDWSIYQREQLPIGYRVEGPAVIEEYASTLVIDHGDVAVVGPDGALDISINTGASSAGTQNLEAAK